MNVVAYFDLLCFIWELFCSLVAKNDIVHKINTLLMILWFKFLAILYYSRESFELFLMNMAVYTSG